MNWNVGYDLNEQECAISIIAVNLFGEFVPSEFILCVGVAQIIF